MRGLLFTALVKSSAEISHREHRGHRGRKEFDEKQACFAFLVLSLLLVLLFLCVSVPLWLFFLFKVRFEGSVKASYDKSRASVKET
jgi:hypothetical protein